MPFYLLEASTDGSAYRNYQFPITFSDGVHGYQFRVTDNAGNVTETPAQINRVDTLPPALALTEELELGDSFEYSLQDDVSGLSVVRIVIEDEDERFPKVAWEEQLSGNKFKDDFVWDGRFKDGTSSPIGEYLITVKASDAAGNETTRSGIVKVKPLSYLQEIPKFTPPAESPLPEGEAEQTTSTRLSASFGGNTIPVTGTTSQSLNFSGSASGATTNTTSTNPSTSSGQVLWGAMAAALIGAATAAALEEQKKRREAEAAQAAQVRAEVEAFNAAQAAKRIAMTEQWRLENWQQGQATLNAQIEGLRE